MNQDNTALDKNDLSVTRSATGLFTTAGLLSLLYFMPASLPFLFGVSSFALGLVAALVVAWLIYGMGWTEPLPSGVAGASVLLTSAAAFFVIVHLVVASQIAPIDLTRGVSSLAILLFVILSVPLIAHIIFNADDDVIASSLTLISVLFAIVAMLSVIGLQPPTESTGEKPIFPYTEPAFFALTFAPVLIYVTVSSPLWLKLAWLVGAIGLALVLANLTLLVVCLLAAIISLPIPILGVSAATTAGFVGLLDLRYFIDRIDFTMHTTNLSTLVYIQGWQLLDESVRNTLGWGLGFQQLGFGYTNVSASIRLNQLLGFDLNLSDGGFILAKIGSEFGVFGIAMAGALLLTSIRSIVTLRLMTYHRRTASSALVFAHATTAAAVIEVLVRGANYFTGSLVMVLAACFSFVRSRRSSGQTIA